MIKRRNKRKNPEIIYDEGMQNLARGLIFGNGHHFANAQNYYRQGFNCKDCDQTYAKCKCEYCEDCKYNRCMCSYDIENDDERHDLIRKDIWKLAKKVLKDNELEYLVNQIFYSIDLNEWSESEMRWSNFLKKLHDIVRFKSDAKKLRKVL